jgi:hypothetical protein
MRFDAVANLMAGASGDKIIHRYRQLGAVNAKRLRPSLRAMNHSVTT